MLAEPSSVSLVGFKRVQISSPPSCSASSGKLVQIRERYTYPSSYFPADGSLLGEGISLVLESRIFSSFLFSYVLAFQAGRASFAIKELEIED